VKHLHSSAPRLAGVSAHSSSGPNLLQHRGCAAAVLKDPAGSCRRDNHHLFPVGKVLDGPATQVARDSTVLPSRHSPDSGITCSAQRCCSAAQVFTFKLRDSIYPGCSALLSVRSAFTAAPKHRNVLQTVLPNMQDTDVASRGGGCPRWPGSCDGDPGTGLQLSPVPSAGVPGHLTALLPADKPRSLPRASLGGAIPPSECAHRVQPRLFPTRVLLVIKGELQSFIAYSINAP